MFFDIARSVELTHLAMHELESSRQSPKGIIVIRGQAGKETSFKTGGANRDRTDDLRVANATLSQLSYGPSLNGRISQCNLVGLGGVAPPTSPLSGVRSN